MNAPYSQISGSILLNNSKITGENFNIGNHGKIYISTSGANSEIVSNNTSFGIFFYFYDITSNWIIS